MIRFKASLILKAISSVFLDASHCVKEYISWYLVVEEFLSVSLIYHEIWLISRLLLCVPEAVQFARYFLKNNVKKILPFFHNFRPFFHTSNLCANHRAYSRRLQSWCTSTGTATSKRPEWWMAFETPFADAEVLRVVSKNSPKSLRNLIGATKSTNGSPALNGVRNQETVFGKWYCVTQATIESTVWKN